jgi:hypothetical protein
MPVLWKAVLGTNWQNILEPDLKNIFSLIHTKIETQNSHNVIKSIGILLGPQMKS